MQRLQKLDKETGEFLPSPSSVNSQAVPFSETLPSRVSTQPSPVTQNPLLSALLFSKSQKPPSQEQAFSELLSLPDLQYYLDVLESEGSSLPLENITEICHHNLPEPQRENSTDELCDIGELTQTISDSFEVAQPLSCMPSDPLERFHDIINLPVEAFNEAISSCKLNHAQHAPQHECLIRDIRRRGKNKMAAQSCRKRKLDNLVDLEDEIEALKREKDKSKEEKERNTRDLHVTKEKLKNLYNEVFRQLRDEHGNSYNPKEYKLQHSTDGTVYLLPRSTANKKNTLTEDLATAV
ncbi:Nuclear factor erythroid 2-related factor 2 [Anabarilius grahami]|uniref:Nuclear factor erythroid 2-related factor 2 n=1 Tax=Anabarilius grahami TaxID=495550 RepID=A0A3N0Y6D4_ANAGA|nr:Nuclear factor erythroid 2-related factor 2 [Anabarilius grahami]